MGIRCSGKITFAIVIVASLWMKPAEAGVLASCISRFSELRTPETKEDALKLIYALTHRVAWQESDKIQKIANAAQKPEDVIRFLKILRKSSPTEISMFANMPGRMRISAEAALNSALDPILGGRLPSANSYFDLDNVMHVLLSHELDSEQRMWARAHAAQVARKFPELAKKMKALASAQNNEVRFFKDPAGKVSLLWYPHYPDRTSWTHSKILVGDEVWSTMGEYTLLMNATASKHLAKQKRRLQYFKFDIQTNAEEFETIKQLLKTNDTVHARHGTCIEGACLVLENAGVMKIPPGVSRIPSLAALYLSIARVIPGNRVSRIEFVGRNVGSALLSFDIVIDTVTVGAVTASVLTPPVVVISGVKLALAISKSEEEQKKIADESKENSQREKDEYERRMRIYEANQQREDASKAQGAP